MVIPSPTTSSASSPVTVTLRDNRVTQVVWTHIPDEQRNPEAVDRAVRAAFVAAALGERTPSAPGTERPVPRRVTRPEPIRLDNILVSGRPLVTPDLAAAKVAARAQTGPVTGESDNRCVSVVLDAGGSAGRVASDPGWLVQATPTQLSTSLTEAFDSAYRKRDQP